MRTRPLGRTGFELPLVGQGTWNLELADRRGALAALRAGLDQGMSHIDTAEMYGGGMAEELVGEALAARRGEAFIASKVLPSNASFEGTLSACERSLRRLRTDRLDLYLLHWRGPHPLEETFAAFEKLLQQGKVRSWGVSNFDVADLEEALKSAGEGKLACNQVLYHLKERAIEERLVPFCERHRITVVAYSPFGSGDFPLARGAGGSVLAEVAAANRATPRQVALAFLLRLKGVVAIPKHSTVPHAVENAGAAQLELSERDIARLDQAFPMRSRKGLPVV
ncbi:MAG: aldo/keto reductase [Myxococcales bacterium]|nr:aldo/keto reductase [Myxococcales bacterium]